MEVSNNLLGALVIVAMALSIAGTMNTLSMMQGRPGLITGMGTNPSQSGTANASLSSEVHIQLINTLVNFGTIAPNTYNDTADLQPLPFVLRNNGTIVVNVSIGESTSGGSAELWSLDSTCESCFQYNSTQNSTVSGAVSYTTWTSFSGAAESADAASLSTNPANLVYNLSTLPTNNQRDVNIHLNITPPTSEPNGYKEATIYFKAAAG